MDKQKMEKIYEDNAKAVYKYLFCLTHDADISEELTQETFYQATKGIDRFRGECKSVEVFRMLHQFDETTREVMYLRLAGELSFAEIGNIMGKTENWARVTFYRGKQKIMKGREEWNRN